MPLYLSAALRHAVDGVLRVQTFPQQAKEQVLVSFDLPRLRIQAEDAEAETEKGPREDASLETCRRMVEHLGGTLNTWDAPAGGIRVGLGVSL